MNYYNEFDPYAAQWLRNLIAAGHLPKGEVDSRSIKDVKASELAGFVQCHFFAGLGGWSYALRLAGWPEDRPVWTGSCPCQPFSAAGSGGGVTDERHLWPTWFNLIRECRPDVIFGEQVEAAVNHGWLDLVQTDLAGEGYASGAVGIPAGGVGAPHIRQRLWFVADSELRGRKRIAQQYTARIFGTMDVAERTRESIGAHSASVSGLADADSGRHDGRATATGRQAGASPRLASGSTFDQLAKSNGFVRRAEQKSKQPTRGTRGESVRDCGPVSQLADAQHDGHAAADGLRETVEPSGQAGAHGVGESARSGDVDQLADAKSFGYSRREMGNKNREKCPVDSRGKDERLRQPGLASASGNGSLDNRISNGRDAQRNDNAEHDRQLTNTTINIGFWSDCDWLPCRDGKARPVEPGTFPLAHGVSGRVGRLRAYGNAIVPQVAQVFIEAYLES